MKKTSDFLYASPTMKSAMVLDGFQSVSATILKLSAEMRVLNGWLATLPGYIACGKADKIDTEKLNAIMLQGAANIDDLTEQVMIQSQKVEYLLEYLEKQNNLNPSK